MKIRIAEMDNGDLQVQKFDFYDNEWILPFSFELQRTPVFQSYEQAKQHFNYLIDCHEKNNKSKTVMKIHDEIELM